VEVNLRHHQEQIRKDNGTTRWARQPG